MRPQCTQQVQRFCTEVAQAQKVQVAGITIRDELRKSEIERLQLHRTIQRLRTQIRSLTEENRELQKLIVQGNHATEREDE